MNARLLMLPLFLASAVLAGCGESAATTPDPAAAAKAADTKADVDKAAADAKAKIDKTDANAKADADKAAADANTAAFKAEAEAGKEQAAKLLSSLKTAVSAQKWTDAEAIINQLEPLRDKLPADQQASFDSLKKLYSENKH